MDNEVFDIVDMNDVPLFCVKGKKLLHSVNKPHRAVHVIMETFGGGFVLQRKATGTENAGKLSSAVSGHVRSSETYEEAAVRETEEELGLKIKIEDLNFVAKLHPCTETGNEFVKVYSYLIDNSEKNMLGGQPLSGEVDEIIITTLTDLIADIKVNENDYSTAFIYAFKKFV